MNEPDALAVVLPVRNLAGTVEAVVAKWLGALKNTGRAWELVVVDDGSTDGTAAKLEAAGKPGVVLLKHDSPLGTGAAYRTALDTVTAPLVLLASADYPYSPTDLAQLLARIDTASEVPDPTTDDFVMRKPDVVCGCRTGVPVPALPRFLGAAYRTFCKIALGLPLAKVPSWYGFREHAFAWWVWVVYGVPLEDPNCGFKLFRTAFLRRFPIQSDGDFVQVEVVAKATFLNGLLDEVPLTPQPTPVPRARWTMADRRKVFGKPKFVKQAPAVPAAVESV